MTSSIIRRRRFGVLASGRLMLYCLTPMAALRFSFSIHCSGVPLMPPNLSVR